MTTKTVDSGTWPLWPTKGRSAVELLTKIDDAISTGLLLAIGPGNIHPDAVGEVVLFMPDEVMFKLGGRMVFIVDETSVLAVLSKDALEQISGVDKGRRPAPNPARPDHYP